MNLLAQNWRNLAPGTKLAALGAVAAITNPFVGLIVGLVAVWLHTNQHPLQFQRGAIWYAIPTLVALGYLAQGHSLPPDDLLRHLSAWQLGFDYRAQYPWSEIPAIDPWLGFDAALGALQAFGLSKQVLLQWVPGVCVVLQAVVTYAVLRGALPRRHQNPALLLVIGALGMLLMTPRSMLGRPEMFLLLYSALAMLIRERWQLVLWVLGFFGLTFVYWLGWAYAPMVLLAPISLRWRTRFALAAGLMAGHIFLWQLYSGDYVGLMVWLKSTLSVLATENAPMVTGFSNILTWLLVAALTLAMSGLRRGRLRRAVPTLLLLAWLCAPNQIRYLAAFTLVSLPWLYRTYAVYLRAYRIKVPSVLVLLSLAAAAALSVRGTEPLPTFELPRAAKVFSESTFSTVFYSSPGISVEPSFAFGATKPQWRDVRSDDGVLNCPRIAQAGFTHIIEKSLSARPRCAELIDIQGPWRLWKVRKD